MGCAASIDRAERRRRVRALGHSDASTAGLLLAPHHNGGQQQESVSVSAAVAGRRRGCKVAPEPDEEDPAEALAMPGSPSFRFYCQKTAAVDALVAAADADGSDSDGESVRIKEPPQAIKEDVLAHNTSKFHNSKDANRWLKFRGLAIVAAAVYGLFNRHSRTPAKSHCPCAASAPAAAAAVSHP